jgi:amino acid adenylation domain-containing protein
LDGIAIIGMAGRFPRARDLQELWHNLRDGVDCISDFADGELEVPVPPEVLRDPRFVKARGVLDGVDLFDAAFFDIPPRQAELMDPQHRLFLETAWQALEDAGYDPQRYPGSIGIFGGVTLSSYFLRHLQSNPDLLQALGSYQVALGTDRDYLTTLVSYKLGLRGPSLDVQTACSTSLVAAVLACQSLLGYHCDMALAGGVSIKVPQKSGYLYQPGGLDSSDGRCRAFDARADGSVYGSGVGVAVLKRLEDALADGDAIHAVILGGAINNDGAARVGFTAPGVEGQAEVIANAQALAGVDPETIGYVECHGTGTALGDPIEVAALTRAFRSGGARRRGFCAIGSVKTNIGHCSAAAGIAGLLKATLALRHRQIPPSLHFEQPNPGIDFAASPFRVSDRLANWEADGHPRRAGVSSFGLGGTNAHVVLEEAPEPEPSDFLETSSRPWQLLVLSARSEAALEAATDALATDLAAHPDRPLADVSFTAQVGRRAFPHRRALVCRDTEDARQALAGRDPRRLLDAVREPGQRPVAFLFPGVGDHYPGMARGLYDTEPVFREHFDRCCELMAPRLGGDLRAAVFGEKREEERPVGGAPDLKRLLGREPRQEGRLSRTLWAQPAVFAVEIALARLWMEWGVRPDALLGYSLGEYTAACLAGVLPLEDAALLVAERARLLEGLPAGVMLAIPLPESEIAPRLAAAGLDLAAVNTPGVCVAAGPEEAVQELRDELAAEGVPCRLLPVGHAFHSRWMEPVAPALTRLARGLRLSPPKIPYVSNVTGTWITPAEATDPESWARHLCQPVRFAAGLATLWQDPARVLLEVGPGFGLSTLALQTADGERLALPSLPNEHDPQPDPAFLLTALGKLWLAGVAVDWEGFWKGERRRRVRLPGYPFERQRFWIEAGQPPRQETAQEEAARLIARLRELGVAVESIGSDRSVGSVGSSAPLAARHARPRLRNAWVAPRTAAEGWVAGVFETLLGIQGVGAHDSFFELGGHSLLATQVLARLRDRFGVELQLAAFFAEPTAAGLAERVEAEAVVRESRPVPVPREGDLPLSFAQERLWFLDRLMPGNPFYNLVGGVRLSGPLEVPGLHASFAALARRHETLRTGFPEVEGRPVQRIAGSVTIELPVIDLAGLPEKIRADQTARIARERARQPFDLTRPPLLRAALVHLGPDEHALFYTIHHIVADAWSLGVLTREIAVLYGGRELPPLPVQYADFAVWQRGWLAGEVLERQLGYWRERLAGAPVTELPADRPRLALQSFRGATRRVVYPARLAAAVGDLAQQSGASPFMVLLAGFLALVARWTGQDDLVVGTPIANRRLSEVEGVIGLFVNTLVLRAGVEGDPDGRTLIERVKAVCLDAYAHQDLPFEQLVEALQPRRDLSRNPLFQVMFNLLNVSPGAPGRIEAGDGRLALSPLPAAGGTSLFDLHAYVTHGEEGIAVAWEHATDLFEEPTIERFSRGFAAVLAGLAGRPAARLSDLPLLGEAERHQLTAEWNDTGSEPPLETTVHGLFAAQAARTPEAVAVVAGAESLTYAELAERVASLARHLRALGVQPGVLVGVRLERSPEMVGALLGVLAAGGAYVPLDPQHPEERQRWVLEDSGAALVLTEPLPDGFGDGPLEPLAGPEDLASVIYTSGSTGRPKGVEVRHGAVANFLASMAREPGLGPEDRLLAVTTISFDIAGLELFLPFMVGARVVLASREEAVDGARLAAKIRSERITALQATPATWRLLLAAGWPGEPDLKALCGGEALPADLAADLLPRVGSLWNLYGPTETTIWSAIQRIEPGGPVAIGRPIANTEIHLLDRGLLPVPLGVAGELCIGGAGLARGYHGRPDLTAERFIPDAHGAAGARLYRTGDRARRRPDGRIEFLGRIDHQIKIRGFRVEPGEIEAALREQPGVREAVVLLREDVPGDPRLVAYLVAGEEAGEADRREMLHRRLPAYMIPAAFVRLDALPLTPGGKVDRRALPAPESDRGAAVSEPPRTAVEEALAAIWQSVLRVSALGVRDDFFDLGGHSLLAAQVAARIREAFGVELPLATLFQATTLEALAARIEASEGESSPPLVPFDGQPGEPVPLSFAQERLWFLDRLDGASPVYNLPSALRLTGRLDRAALAGALSEITRRHAALRTTFGEREGRPVQVIAPPAPFPLPLIDLSSLGVAAQPEARRLAVEEALRPFDLQRGPVLRATLLRLGETEHAVLFTLHHIAGDAWSLGVLTQEVAALYGALTAGRPSPLPELPVQYADYARWQRAWLQGEALARRLAFWREALDGVAALQLPADRPRPPLQTFCGAAHLLKLAPVETPAGTTQFMALLAGLTALLHRWADQDDVAVGSPVAGRSRVQLEPLIGFFVNTLVLRTDCGGDPPYAALLGRVRDAVVAALSHQEIPFEKVVEELQPARDLSHTPLFQVLFTLQNTPTGTLDLPGLTLAPLAAGGEPPARFDLTLAITEGPDGLFARFDYNVDLFDAATIARLADQWARVLTTDPGLRLSEIPLLSEAEAAQLLRDWSGGAPLGAGTGVWGLFAAQAARTPEETALVFEGETFRYRELLAWSNQLAHRLRSLGVGPEVRVGIALERSPEVIAAMLAVLAAGGAYVPLDPGYPRERLAFLLEDSRPWVVLTGDVEPALNRQQLAVERPADFADPGPPETLPGSGPDSPVYVIYTSGSTGTPKGVTVCDRGLANFSLAMVETLGLGPGERFLQFASLSFDASAVQIFPTLLSGAALVLHPDPTRLSVTELLHVCERQGVTVLDLPAALWRQWVEEMGERVRRGERLPHGLHTFLTGGESLSRAALERWLGLPDRPARFFSSYGPTEATITATLFRLEDDAGPGLGAPIGRPLPGVRVALLDRRLHPVPVGVPGELAIGGAGVARGYLDRPDLTAERFIPDAFGAGGAAGGRLYRTGDLVRLRLDGSLEILGRMDGQVKIRGVRIELGEIEAVLARCPGVREAVAVVRGEGIEERRLVVYAVPEIGQALEPADLRAWLAARLPGAMVPPQIVLLESLPLTASGKVDRRALPEPQAPVREVVAPRDAVEERLAEVWRRLLNVPAVSVHDNFFALGGHSLLATRLVAAVREEMETEIPLRDVFERPVLADLALAVARRQAESLDEAELSRMFQDLEGLSDEEVERLLAGEAAEERINEGQDR